MRLGGVTHAPARPAPRSPAPPAASRPSHPYLSAAQLTVAGSVIYSYVTLLPLLFWLLLRYYEASKKLADVLCIYGYTMAIFIPVTVLCVLPSNLLRWLLVLLGGGARPLHPPHTHHTTRRTPPRRHRRRRRDRPPPRPRAPPAPPLHLPALSVAWARRSHLFHLPPLQLPCAPGRLLPVRRERWIDIDR